jgi:hypothetical protein
MHPGSSLPQDRKCGGLWTGLAAGVTGTDASAIMVASFLGSTETLFSPPSIGTAISATHSATLGSQFKIQREGVWQAKATVQAQTAASVLAAMGIDNTAAQLNTDPGVKNGVTILDRKLSISAAADSVPIVVDSGPIYVSRDLAFETTAGTAQALVRLLLSNNAGAGAADASILVASCEIEILRICDMPAQLHG